MCAPVARASRLAEPRCLLTLTPGRTAQYQRTTDGLAEAGRTAWSTAQRTRDRAMNTPNALMGLFGKSRTPYRERSTHSLHDEWGGAAADAAQDLRHQLLPSRWRPLATLPCTSRACRQWLWKPSMESLLS